MKPQNEKEKQWAAEDEELEAAPGAEWTKKFNVTLPVWALKIIDKEAARRGMTRHALVTNWLIDKADELQERDRLKSATG
jgi:transcriptional regulator of met regulon